MRGCTTLPRIHRLLLTAGGHTEFYHMRPWSTFGHAELKPFAPSLAFRGGRLSVYHRELIGLGSYQPGDAFSCNTRGRKRTRLAPALALSKGGAQVARSFDGHRKRRSISCAGCLRPLQTSPPIRRIHLCAKPTIKNVIVNRAPHERGRKFHDRCSIVNCKLV